MHSKSRYPGRRFELGRRGSPGASAAAMSVLCEAGQWERLAPKARAAARRHPGQAAGWRFLGQALAGSGKWSQALAALSRAARLAPTDARAHNELGRVFYNLGREYEAEASYRRALACAADFLPALNNLGALLADLGRLAEAAAALQRSLEINPRSDFALHCLGMLVDRVGGHDQQALAYLERSLELNPDNADACVTTGNIFWRTGRSAEALAMFRRARQLRPLITWRARKEQADFSVLLLFAPGSGCTPVNYLVGKAPFDCHFYCVLPEAPPPSELELLREKADVVVNMIADPDYGREILPFARDLVQRLGRPTCNPPSLVMNGDRESVAGLLAGIPHCRIPKTLRLAGRALLEGLAGSGLAGFSWPLLVRLAGNHGGDDFEMFRDPHAVAAFVARRPEADYYLIEFLDYRSADGYFRKYRLIGVHGLLFPYHLAIHDHWKVHHFRTDMAGHAWMRREEEAFLAAPQQVFDPPRLAALRAVLAATGLDYCGVDCALDARGDIVVFETNASMLVHDETDPAFAYKNPYIAGIKAAFAARLARLARQV